MQGVVYHVILRVHIVCWEQHGRISLKVLSLILHLPRVDLTSNNWITPSSSITRRVVIVIHIEMLCTALLAWLQIPYPANAVVPGMIKMNMARFVLWHEAKEWRFVLKDDWMTAATQPDAVIRGQQLAPLV